MKLRLPSIYSHYLKAPLPSQSWNGHLPSQSWNGLISNQIYKIYTSETYGEILWKCIKGVVSEGGYPLTTGLGVVSAKILFRKFYCTAISYNSRKKIYTSQLEIHLLMEEESYYSDSHKVSVSKFLSLWLVTHKRPIDVGRAHQSNVEQSWLSQQK